jgi:long-subunit fatty acid transport protein
LLDLVPRLRFHLAAVAATFLAARALAGPLEDAHVADTGFAGPTTGDLASVYWNPAGLGLLQGPQVMVGGAWQTTSVSVNRMSIDPATGGNPGSRNFPAASGSGTLQPFRWPPGPGGFAAIGAGIGRRFGIALALYSPFSSTLTMKPADDGSLPTRYHLVSMRFDHTALATGLAIHASDSIQVGVTPGLLFPSAHLVFDEDTGIGGAGIENPTKSARYDLASNGIQIPSYFMSFGADYRRGRFSLGISYTTAPLGTGGLVTLPLDNTQITPPGGAAGDLCAATSTANCLVGQMRYRLPSMYVAGATWQATPHWSATGIARWIRNGAHDNITILVAGPASGSQLGSSIPDHVVLYRGFTDSFDLRGRAVYEDKHFRASGTLRLETSAVPASHVNAAAIDGTKVTPSLAVEMRVWRQVRMSAGYAFTYMLPVDAGTSAFDPTAASACTAAVGDLSTPACQARANGQARPSAAGTYHMWRQTLSVYTSFGF